MAKHGMRPPTAARTLATVALLITGLPVLVSVLMAATYVVSYFPGAGVVATQVATMILYLIASVAAIALYFALQQGGSVRFAWLLSISTVALLIFSASLSTFTIGAGFVDEWCESQPGGRGWPGPTDRGDIPWVCE